MFSFGFAFARMVVAPACKGVTPKIILANLFKGYKAASDKVCVECIILKEEEYEEGSPMTADSLMNLAANKYKTWL